MESIHTIALSLIHQSVPSWQNITTSTSSITLLTGNSNAVYKVENFENVSPQKLIYRVFGTDEVTDKIREDQIIQHLGTANLAPRIYISANRTRIEEFWDGFEPIPRDQMSSPNIRRLVAERLHLFH